MRTIFYSIKDFELPFLEKANTSGYDVKYCAEHLSASMASVAGDCAIVCLFADDDGSAIVLEKLYKYGVKYIAIRAAGYDNVDVAKVRELGIKVANVPEYSPYAIAEHAVGMMLALNRKLVLSDKQVHHHNFTVDNLIGFDLHKKTVGIVGTGRIGSVVAKILNGFGCNVLGYDIYKNEEIEKNRLLKYVDIETLCRLSDIITLHTCLTPQTKHLVNRERIALMKDGVMLINTSRGAVISTTDVIEALENGHIGYLGLDVYEKEKGVFFYNHSNENFSDPLLDHLLALPNVLVTPHQAFASREAIANIAETTFTNIASWVNGEDAPNTL